MNYILEVTKSENGEAIEVVYSGTSAVAQQVTLSGSYFDKWFRLTSYGTGFNVTGTLFTASMLLLFSFSSPLICTLILMGFLFC